MSSNGKLLPAELVEVQSGISLSPRSAAAWLAMKAAAAQAGVTLTIAIPYGGYRDLAGQRAIILSGSHSGIQVAALGSSTHGFGTRVDVANWYAPRSTWLLANAALFGFTREFGDRDPNHFKHDGRATATPTATTTRKVNPVISVARIIRKGVGEHIMYASGAGVRLSVELSMLTATDRTFHIGVAKSVRVAADLPAEIPTIDDTPNGGWYIRNQLAAAAAGMPADYPLSPSNPFIAAKHYAANSTTDLTAAFDQIPTAAENADATADEIAERGKA